MMIIPALLFTTLRYFPHYYVSTRLAIINKCLYIGAFIIISAYLIDFMQDGKYYSLIRQSLVYWFIIGIILSVFLIIQHILPFSFSYIMLKQKIIDVNFHLPKLVLYTSIFLLSLSFYLLWHYAIRGTFMNQDLLVVFDFLGVLLLICFFLILHRYLPPFISKKIFGHHDQMQQHIPIKYESGVHGFIYLGVKVNGSRLKKEELGKLDDLLEYGSNVMFTALFIHQLEKEKKHLFDNNQMVQREVSQLQMYNDCLLEAQEKERKDLSTYLHDQILQNAIFLNRALEASVENSDKEHIKSALEISSQVVLDIREKCFDLYPAMIEDIGFVETCEYFFSNNRIYTGGAIIAWSCNFTDKETQLLSKSEQKIIYRCVKELIMNAIKHAMSKRIDIKFEKKNHQFIFSVTDNGKCFTVPRYLSKTWVENKHIGLITVKQNIERIGGHLDISSSKDKGTRLSICLNRPIKKNKNMEKAVVNETYTSVVSR